MDEPDTKQKHSFIHQTLSLLLEEGLQECRRPDIQSRLQTSICDPLLEYCIQQLTPYYLLLVIIFIVLLIVISILLAFIILGNTNTSRL